MDHNKAICKTKRVEVIWWQFNNRTEDIPAILDLVQTTGKLTNQRPEDNKVPAPIRWNSSDKKLTVPGNNGEDVNMKPGDIIVAYKSKQLDVMSKKYFETNFKEINL